MAFNHYAKIKRILQGYDSWHVIRINRPTTAKKFNGEQRTYEHYYRIYDASKKPIPYCKFQQLDLFARTMNIPQEDIVIQTIE
jgi:hypothetical protein